MNRRDSLKALTVGTIGAAALIDGCKPGEVKKVANQSVADGFILDRQPEELKQYDKVVSSTFFSEHEMATITILADIIMTAAAPSLMPDALPAVTVPSLENAGRNADRASAVVPALMYSSVSNTVLPFLLAISSGKISSLNLPACCAASALFCEAAANSSCSWREMLNFFATFSAVVPM